MFLYAGYLTEFKEFFLTISESKSTHNVYFSMEELQELEIALQRAKKVYYESFVATQQIEKMELPTGECNEIPNIWEKQDKLLKERI